MADDLRRNPTRPRATRTNLVHAGTRRVPELCPPD